MKTPLLKVCAAVVTTAAALITSAPILSFSASDTERDNRHLHYEDLFHLEYAANPIVMPDGKTVMYERRSMDIMSDSLNRNLWTVSLDGATHLPWLADGHHYYNPVFSADGSKLAYLSNQSGSAQIYVQDLATLRTAKITDVTMNPSNIAFSPDGRLLAFTLFTPTSSKPMFSLPTKPKGANWAEDAHVIEQTLFQRDGAGMKKDGNLHIYVVPSIGGTPRQVTSGAFDYAGQLAFSADGKHIIVSANTRDDADFDVFNSDLIAVNLTTGETNKLTSSTGPESQPSVSPNGELLAFTGFEDNGKSNQITQLYVMEMGSDTYRSLTPELDRSVGDVSWAADNNGLYFSYDDHGQKHLAHVTLDGEITIKTDALGGMSLGRPYTSGQYAVTANGQLVYTLGNGVRPADLASSDSSGKTVVLTDLNSDVLGHKTLNAPELMTVKSSVDERELQAWIVKPPQFDPSKTYPLILEIHGGPHTAYGPEFSTEVQMFAAAGYVVVYGNPRGSTSQGAEFANLIDKNYPSQDYNDLMDMVDGVIAKGYIDEQNLFVTGGSGGGVLTAWIIGNTDRFAAAVVAKPVINWISMIGTSDIYTFMARYWFTDLPWNDVDQYWQRSPLSLVGNVTTPTMVLTGELDVRTPMAESEQYYGALRLQGVDSAFVRIQGAYHGIAAKPSNLGRKIGHILAWFEKYQTQQEN